MRRVVLPAWSACPPSLRRWDRSHAARPAAETSPPSHFKEPAESAVAGFQPKPRCLRNSSTDGRHARRRAQRPAARSRKAPARSSEAEKFLTKRPFLDPQSAIFSLEKLTVFSWFRCMQMMPLPKMGCSCHRRRGAFTTVALTRGSPGPAENWATDNRSHFILIDNVSVRLFAAWDVANARGNPTVNGPATSAT